MKAVEILKAGYKLIKDEKRWCRGEPYRPSQAAFKRRSEERSSYGWAAPLSLAEYLENGSFCAIGAVQAVTGVEDPLYRIDPEDAVSADDLPLPKGLKKAAVALDKAARKLYAVQLLNEDPDLERRNIGIVAVNDSPELGHAAVLRCYRSAIKELSK